MKVTVKIIGITSCNGTLYGLATDGGLYKLVGGAWERVTESPVEEYEMVFGDK